MSTLLAALPELRGLCSISLLLRCSSRVWGHLSPGLLALCVPWGLREIFVFDCVADARPLGAGGAGSFAWEYRFVEHHVAHFGGVSVLAFVFFSDVYVNLPANVQVSLLWAAFGVLLHKCHNDFAHEEVDRQCSSFRNGGGEHQHHQRSPP